MVLVSSLDGGAPTSTSKTVYAVLASLYGPVTGNYSRDGIAIVNQTNSSDPGINARDGGQKLLADFKTQLFYDGAGWDFTGGWKFTGGYDYPALSWQNGPPDLSYLPPPPPPH
jgi:hypothetical protein